MYYHFVNVETGEYFYCEEQVWIRALEAAKNSGWDPYGTIYDLEYDINDECEFVTGRAQIIFTILCTMRESSNWDGSYTAKRNQVLDFNDTVYLTEALEGTDTDPDLISFVDKGSFRICSD